MTPESARIRQLINGLSYTVEVLECLDALDARLETAERERGEALGDLENAQYQEAQHRGYAQIVGQEKEAAERRAEQLTSMLNGFRPIIRHALWGGSVPDALRNIDRAICKALASVEGAGGAA